MRFNNLVSLSATAALLLQMGTFVSANPMFVDTASSPAHSNNAINDDSCQDVRITFPASSDAVFENNSKHVVAWQLPQNSYKQVNLTLVNEDDSSDVTYLGLYDANLGASNETDFSVANPGDYHVNLEALGGSSSCQTNSVPFAIETSTHVDAEETDEIIKNIRGSSSKPKEQHDDSAQKQSWEEALQEIDNYLEKSKKNNHSNEKPNNTDASDDKYPTYDKFIKDLEQDYHKYIDKNKDTEDKVINHKNDADQNQSHSDSPYFTNTDQRTHANDHLNAEIDELARSSKHNDAVPDNEHFTNEDQRSHIDKHLNAEIEMLVGSIKHDDDNHRTHANDHLNAELDRVIGNIKSQSNGNMHVDAEIDEAIRNIKNHSETGEGIHMNDRLISELNSLPHDHDDGDWSVEEVHENVEWVDQSAVPDHSNEGEWVAEEVDPNTAHNVHSNSDVVPEEKDFDHSNVGEWIAEEIEQTPEPKEAEKHVDAVAGEWIEEGSVSAVPDHSNVGMWVAEEIIDDEALHRDSQWTEEHTDAEPSWIAEEIEHENVEPAWITEEPEHGNAAPAWMAEEVEHPNAESAWIAEEAAHSDSAESGWVADDDRSNNAQHLDDNIAIYSAEDLIN